MGDLFRRFWVPILLERDLPGPDCGPVGPHIMGQRLVAFRDSQDRLGLLDARCPHRGADLTQGINEEGGLRCLLCGWKFDVLGNCLETPFEPPGSTLKDQIHVDAYPLREWAGVYWAYVGPSTQSPAWPEFEWGRLPADHRYVSRYLVECNYMQAVEGSLDASRLAFLQRMLGPDGAYQPSVGPEAGQKIVAKYTGHGLTIGARSDAADGAADWEITQWLFPFYTTAPPQPGGLLGSLAWVPIDDENTMAFAVTYHPSRPLSPTELRECRDGGGLHPEVAPGTYRRKRTRSGQFLLEGEDPRINPLGSIAGILEKALVMQESMGAIVDRADENLGPNDVAVFAAWDRLLKAAIDLREGVEPLTTQDGSLYRVRPVAATLAAAADFDADPAVTAMLHPPPPDEADPA